MENDKLRQKLASYLDEKRDGIVYRSVTRDQTSLDEIRDAMLDVGVIFGEDLDQGIYVARVTGGRRKPYGPIIAATPSVKGVDVSGIVFRKRDEVTLRAMGSFKLALEGHPPKIKRRFIKLRLILILVVLLATVIAFLDCYYVPRFVIPAQTATVEYSEAVEEFNSIVPRYNSAAKGVAVGNLKGFAQEAQELTVQSADYISVFMTVAGGNSAEKIKNDTLTVRRLSKELEEEIPVLVAINNPDRDWVMSRLEGVDGISEIHYATSDKDPNEMLGKEGGCTSCIYFTNGLLGKGVVKGKTPVDKGVDGEGAVEVYRTVDDAEARCEYLSGFDRKILHSGTYAIVGTMVIRTSCLLDDDTQYALTNNIVNSMINGENSESSAK